MAGDLLVLSGADDEDPDGASGAGEIPVVRVGGRVAVGIEVQTQETQAGARFGSDAGRVLTDTAGEDDGADTAGRGGHGGNPRSEAVQVHRQGQRGALVTGVGGRDDGPHVARRARQPGQARAQRSRNSGQSASGVTNQRKA